MGRSEEWQVQMAGYREGLGEYKKQNDLANQSEEMANNYKSQYADPNTPKAATDTALVADYTTVLARGGRKNKAELEMARNIGDLETNAKTWMFKKFHGGELPPELRNLYLDYIDASAKSQRKEADSLKPDPPTVGYAQGPKTKQLQDSRGGGGNVIVVSPEDMK
jgi:hypothetical protein